MLIIIIIAVTATVVVYAGIDALLAWRGHRTLLFWAIILVVAVSMRWRPERFFERIERDIEG